MYIKAKGRKDASLKTVDLNILHVKRCMGSSPYHIDTNPSTENVLVILKKKKR